MDYDSNKCTRKLKTKVEVSSFPGLEKLVLDNKASSVTVIYNFETQWSQRTRKYKLRYNLPIYAEWTLLPELFEPVHLQFKGCLSVFIITMFYWNVCN